MKRWMGWVLALMMGSALLPAVALEIVTPDALFAELGKPTFSYPLDDGKGWRYATPGKKAFEEDKIDPRGGAYFSVEFRKGRINLAVQQITDDPEQAANNAAMMAKQQQALLLLTGSDEIWPAIEQGRILAKMKGFVNGWTITAMPVYGGHHMIVLER